MAVYGGARRALQQAFAMIRCSCNQRQASWRKASERGRLSRLGEVLQKPLSLEVIALLKTQMLTDALQVFPAGLLVLR